jgi:hypothetical protein
MTPKEKAVELFGKYAMYIRANLMNDEEANEDAKQCALIAVDEIKTLLYNADRMYQYDYWHEVKQEIENTNFIL